MGRSLQVPIMTLSPPSDALSPEQSRHLKIIALLYFIVWGAIGFYGPFVNLYYLEFGLSGAHIGLIGAFGPLMGAAGATLAGLLSDRTGKTRVLFAATSLGLIAAALTLPRLHSFSAILVVAACVAFFQLPMLTILDSTTLKILGARANEYGRYRLWGTIGFIVTNAAAGFVIEAQGIHTIFIAYPAAIALFLVASQLVPDQPLYANPSPYRGVRAMVRQPAWVAFAISVFILWFASTGGLGFLNLTIKHLQGGESLVGLAFTVAAIAEIPLFLFSASILRRVGSTRLLILAFSGYALRFFIYSLIVDPVLIPVVGIMQGISFSPFLIASIDYANSQAPANLKATSQGLLTAVMNLASMLGALTAGNIFDAYGPPGLYLFAGSVATLALVVFLATRWFMLRRSNPSLRETG